MNSLENSIEVLSSAIRALYENIESLEGQLRLVLVPDDRTAEEENPPKRDGSPAVNALLEMETRIHRLNGMIYDIKNRLQVDNTESMS